MPKTYPDWLNLLQGESPLLGRPEWEYIAEVRHRIISETKTVPGFPYDKQLKNKISLMKDNFAQVVKYLKENSQSKEYFLRTYPRWKIVRDLTIFQLKEIAKSVDEDSRNCSVSRGVGSSVSLIGGLIGLAGGTGASRILGSVLMGLGSLASAGTSVVEFDLLRKKIKESEKIIQEDKDYTERLWNRINDISYVNEALNTIRSIDVDRDLKKVANDLHIRYKRNKSSVMENVIIKAIQINFDIPPEVINEIADVIAMLITTSMLYDTYRPLFNRAFEAYKCGKALSTARDVFLSTIKMTSAVDIGKNSKLTTHQKSKIVSSIALDAMNIILTTESVNSTSKEAKVIAKAAEKLAEEAEVFKELYDTMNE